MRTRFTLKSIFPILKETATEWIKDKAPRLGAALSYYTVFSIAPVILIAITIAGLIFADAQAQVIAQVQGLLGEQGAAAVESMIKAAQKPAQSVTATVLGFATLIFGATGVFVQLKDALNTIWGVDETSAKGGIIAFIKKYFLSFSIVLGIGFLLLVSLVLEAGVAIVGELVRDLVPGMDVIMQGLALIISFGVVTFLFAMLFKFLPDVKVAWHDVWIGATLTAILFVIGKIGLGFYLGKAATVSAYGAAGSLVILLLWVYYSSQILFFGAEFTEVYSRRYGSRSDPTAAQKKQPKKRHAASEIEASPKLIHHASQRISP